MLRKLTLGLVAAAALSAMALAPTAAAAGGGGGGFKGCCGGWGGGGWGGYHHHWGHGFGIGLIGGGYGDDGCYQTRRIMTPFGYRLRTVNVCEY